MWAPWVELLDAVFPPACRLCGARAADGLACEEHALPAGPAGARCGRCAARLPRGLPEGFACAACRRSPPPVTRTLTLGDYRADGALRGWVLALKHRARPDLAEPLGALLARRLAGREDHAWLVPIPLHPWRWLERGYDQAALLARAVGRRSGWPVVPALVRRRATAVQGSAGSASRRANVRGAFTLDRGVARGLDGRSAWLVDDVVTSGATTAEAARVLRRAGAGRVGVLCVARAAGVDGGGPVGGSWGR